MPGRKYIEDNPLYTIFHENSKNFEINPVAESDIPDDWMEVEYKEYESTRKDRFDTTNPDSKFEQLVTARRSPSGFVDEPITREELERLLQFTAGITRHGETDDDHQRAYPSGGARYPLEVYPVVLRGDGIEPGCYHFDVRAPALSRIPTSTDKSIESFVYDEIYPQSASVALFLTAKLNRTTRKYGERGYRYALFEAGHAMQNACLAATSLGLACRPYGGFLEDQADDFLGLHSDETTLYLGFVGRPSDDAVDAGTGGFSNQRNNATGTDSEIDQ